MLLKGTQSCTAISLEQAVLCNALSPLFCTAFQPWMMEKMHSRFVLQQHQASLAHRHKQHPSERSGCDKPSGALEHALLAIRGQLSICALSGFRWFCEPQTCEPEHVTSAQVRLDVHSWHPERTIRVSPSISMKGLFTRPPRMGCSCSTEESVT